MSEGYGKNGLDAIPFGETHAARPRDRMRRKGGRRGGTWGKVVQMGMNILAMHPCGPAMSVARAYMTAGWRETVRREAVRARQNVAIEADLCPNRR